MCHVTHGPVYCTVHEFELQARTSSILLLNQLIQYKPDVVEPCSLESNFASHMYKAHVHGACIRSITVASSYKHPNTVYAHVCYQPSTGFGTIVLYGSYSGSSTASKLATNYDLQVFMHMNVLCTSACCSSTVCRLLTIVQVQT